MKCSIGQEIKRKRLLAVTQFRHRDVNYEKRKMMEKLIYST
jgi:hypothetical protein